MKSPPAPEKKMIRKRSLDITELRMTDKPVVQECTQFGKVQWQITTKIKERLGNGLFITQRFIITFPYSLV